MDGTNFCIFCVGGSVSVGKKSVTLISISSNFDLFGRKEKFWIFAYLREEEEDAGGGVVHLNQEAVIAR